jgi:hypothetical protein
MEVDYTISSFLQDLLEIREKTFIKGTIIRAFRESGTWPPNLRVIEKKMAVYAEPRPCTPPLHTKISYDLMGWN